MSSDVFHHRDFDVAGSSRKVQADGLQVHPERIGEFLVLVVAGEADLDTSMLLQEQIAVALVERPSAAIIDLSGLTFCDLAGMDALERALRAANARGIAVAVVGESAQLAWLRRTFPSAPDRAKQRADPAMAARLPGPMAPVAPASDPPRPLAQQSSEPLRTATS